jgi:F5/8 type C domain
MAAMAMKTKSILCLTLVLGGALATLPTCAADTNSLRVIIIPSKTEVRIKEVFKVALRVENPTTTSQAVRVMSCSWGEEWKNSNTNIISLGWPCFANAAVNVEIPPGGAYTNELEMLVPEPISQKTLSFRMGFTSIDSHQTFWSDAVNIGVDPTAAAETKIKLKVVKVDSEETNNQNGRGENAVDGNPNTYWHTEWASNSPGLPHEIVIALVPPSVIKGFTYLPRQDNSDHGNIKDFEFYAGDDGKNFGPPVKKGVFEPGKGEKIETFEPIKCCYIKLKAISEINGLPWTSAAEIGVIQSGEDVSPKNYWRGDLGPLDEPASAPKNSAKTDEIDTFVAALSKGGGLWMNGADADLPTKARTPQEVVAETLHTAKFDGGVLTGYRILKIQEVQIGESSGTHTAVLVDTDLGHMIVLMRYIEGNDQSGGHWWRRIYAASSQIKRLY